MTIHGTSQRRVGRVASIRSTWAWALLATVGLACVPVDLPAQAPSPGGAQAPAAAPPPSLVEVKQIVSRELAEGQTFVGTAIPYKKATVGSAVAGRVAEVFVEVGDRVEEMQPLAQLLVETISLERDSARAELQLRQQLLAELQNGSLPEEIEQARSAMEAAQARVDYLQTRQTRFQQLQGTRSVTAGEVEELLTTFQEAQAAFRQAKATFDLVKQGPRQEKIAQAQATVAVQQALVERLEDMLKKHTMISRFDGYVTAKHTEIGQWVNQGDPVADVVALDLVEIQAFVLETYVPYVRLGQTARVEVPALPGKTFLGEVVSVSAQADPKSRTFEVRVRAPNEFDNELPMIKAGMMARVVLPTGPTTDALLVPKDAVTLGGAQPTVWTVDPATVETYEQDGITFRRGTATPTPVRLGAADGDWIQAIGPLEPGRFVVSKGNERIINRGGQGAAVTWPVAAEAPAATPAVIVPADPAAAVGPAPAPGSRS
ncbi:MAG TPA: efflux RND transporter periplasmic adaptor subunit [Pirellulaceae bacterium]|jgi:RND family efflux transporter MFP subunit|nr:efflux RND transporter periplasmic adaptor subunit [Pirellulaceae bacterium]